MTQQVRVAWGTMEESYYALLSACAECTTGSGRNANTEARRIMALSLARGYPTSQENLRLVLLREALGK